MQEARSSVSRAGAEIPSLGEDDWALVSDFAYLMFGNRSDAARAIEYAVLHPSDGETEETARICRGIVQAAIVTGPAGPRPHGITGSAGSVARCEQIAHCLDRVPAQDRAVLVLHDIFAFSQEAVAEFLDLTMVEVKDRLFAGRVELMDHLTPFEAQD